jgi:hypothetical protein
MPKRRSPGDGGLFYIPSRDLWRGVVDAGFNPNGTRKQVSITSRTQRGARDKLNLLKKETEEFGSLNRPGFHAAVLLAASPVDAPIF